MCDECPSINDYNIIKDLFPEIKMEPYEWFSNVNLKKCNNCNVKLCPKHVKFGLIFGRYYINRDNYILCNKCCKKNIM